MFIERIDLSKINSIVEFVFLVVYSLSLYRP